MSSGGTSCWWQNPGFQAQRRLLENFYVSASLSVKVFVTERFLMRSAAIMMNVIALVMCNEMHWHRESLHKCPHVDRRTIPRATQASGFSCNRESKVHWHGFRFHIATLRNYQLQGFHVLSEHNIHNRLERFLLLFPTSSVWSQIFFNNTFQHPECRGNIRIQSSPNMPDTEGVFKKHGTMPLSSFVLLFWKRLFFIKFLLRYKEASVLLNKWTTTF